MAEADEAGRHARDDGRGFDLFAAHRLVGAGHTERPAGGDAQAVHRFAAEELADGAAQHGAAVAHARIRREAGALELDLLRPLLAGQFAEQDGPPVAQLPGPLAKLVAAVHTGQGPHAGQQAVAGEGLQGVVGLRPGLVQAELARQRRAAAHEVGGRQRRGAQFGVKRRAEAGEAVAPAVGRQAGHGVGARGRGVGRGHAPHCHRDDLHPRPGGLSGATRCESRHRLRHDANGCSISVQVHLHQGDFPCWDKCKANRC
ncbi:hypothetical protein FQZ97_884220 [compost metagenome]